MIRLGNHIQMNILKYIRCLEKGSLLLYNELGDYKCLKI